MIIAYFILSTIAGAHSSYPLIKSMPCLWIPTSILVHITFVLSMLFRMNHAGFFLLLAESKWSSSHQVLNKKHQ